MTKFTVIDSLMGSGKTQYVIQKMNEVDNEKKYIYITPYLNEITRVRESVTERELQEPNNRNDEGRKLRSLKTLVEDGEDIASTHSLLQTADDELIKLLKERNYTLVIDEVIDVIETVNISQTDISRLVRNGDILLSEDGQVSWIGTDDLQTRFKDIFLLSKAGTLFYTRKSMMVKIFSDKVLHAFDEVISMTNQFEYSYMWAWYQVNKINYELKSVKYDTNTNKYMLGNYVKTDENRQELYDLINIYEGKYNDDLKHLKLNRTGYNNMLEEGRAGIDKLDLISKTTRNYLDSHKEKGGKVYWTTFKPFYEKGYLKPRNYSKSFVSLNMRATNEYSDVSCIAYLIERRALPMQRGFFEDKGVKFNEAGWIVADLLQWIYRSRVRNGEPINLFLPSQRMREVLKAWANYEL